MARFGKYKVGGVLRTTGVSTVYRATRVSDGTLVALKVPNSPDSAAVRALLEHEFEIMRRVGSKWTVAALEIEDSGPIPALVLEYFDAYSVADRLATGPLSLKDFFHIAVHLTTALADTHAARVVHCDVKPANVLIRANTLELRLSDFGLATSRASGYQDWTDKRKLRGTLTYISPEQTGRINRSVDSRSDLYSLGISFYEMLVGSPPFQSADAMSLVHAHLARPLPAIDRERPDVPKVVAEIVHRLTQKDPQQRYQQAQGLLADLERCQRAYEQTGTISTFPLGLSDSTTELVVPDRLYGREQAVDRLRTALFRASNNTPQAVVIRGPAGMGKSTLVRTLEVPVLEQHGYMAVGKCEQHAADTPYAPIASALHGMVEQILTERDELVSNWRARLHARLGRVARAAVELVPVLEHLLGPQPDLPPVGPAEARHRFYLAVRRLFTALASREHPLVLFLDDLQWAEPGTLALIEELARGFERESILLVLAYRDDECPRDHGLHRLLAALEDSQILAHTTTLASLNATTTAELLAEALHRSPSDVSELLPHVLQRTGGAPLCLRLYLSHLADLGLLRRQASGEWHWNLRELESANLPDDVVSVVLGRLATMPETTQRILALASAIGTQFDVTTLRHLTDTHTLTAQLGELVDRGMLVASGGQYRFTHDRIRDAGLSALDPHETIEVHTRIGWYRYERTPPSKLEHNAFGILEHLNRGDANALSPPRRLQFAELNVLAGRRALTSSAYVAAAEYFAHAKMACDVLGSQAPFELAFEAAVGHAEARGLAGDIERSETCFDALSQLELSLEQRVRVLTLRASLSSVWSRPEQAVEFGRTAAELMGVRLPTRPRGHHLAREFARSWWALRGRSPQSLLDHPRCMDPQIVAQLDVLSALATPTWFVDQKLNLIVGQRHLQLALQHGYGPDSALALAGHAIFLGAGLGRYADAVQLMQTARTLADRPEAQRIAPRVEFLADFLVAPWTRNPLDAVARHRQNTRRALEVGDLEYAAYFDSTPGLLPLVCGAALGRIRRESQQASERIRRLGYSEVAVSLDFAIHFADLLGGELTADWSSADPLGLRAVDTLSLSAVKYSTISAGAMVALFLGHADVAKRELDAISPYADESLFASFYQADFGFWRALAHAWAAPHSRSTKALLRRQRSRLRRWAKYQPPASSATPSTDGLPHFWCRVRILEAELAILAGKTGHAQRLLAAAAVDARQATATHLYALAHERRIALCLSTGSTDDASLFARTAIRAYTEWGAVAKAERLRETYGELVSDDDVLPSRSSNTTLSTLAGVSQITLVESPRNLDTSTVVDVALAVSEALELDDVLKRVMNAAIANAGAQRGLLAFARDGTLRVLAEGWENAKVSRVAIAIDEHPAAPVEILRLVYRTRQGIVVGDAVADHRYRDVPYVARSKIRSLLCQPIVRRGEVDGVLYLESHVSDVFTVDRLEVLRVLSSQAAISVENARLFDDLKRAHDGLERTVEERTEQLRRARDDAERAAQVKADFLASMSHEIRTPMNGVLGMAQLLAQTPLDAEQTDYVETIQSSGEVLLAIINDILDLSKLEAEKMELERKDFDLWRCIEDAGDILAPMAHAKHLEFPVVIDPDVPRFVMGDQTRLRQVIINLCNNAIKFTSAGEVCLEIGLDADQRLRFEVRDTGIGIPPDRLDRLFRPFSQVDAGTARQYGGTGLGLAICKRLVDAAGGDIGVRSTVGEGSVFWLTLPLPACHETSSAVRGAESLTAFVIDEHASTRRAIASRLQSAGVREVVQASDFDSVQARIHASSLDTTVVYTRMALGQYPAGLHVFKLVPTGSAQTTDSSALAPPVVGLPPRLRQIRFTLQAALGRTSPPPAAANTPTPAAPDLASLRVLVAEDNPVNRKLVARMLERAKIGFEVVENGEEAVAAVLAQAPDHWDALLMDCHMPVMDGLEATRRIRLHEKNSGHRLPIVALTANALPADRQACLDAGMDEHLAKPIKQELLLATLGQLRRRPGASAA